jgi:hydrogenase maturation protease
LIDSLKRAGASPGTIHRLTWPDARLDDLHRGSTHALSPAQALQLAAALNLLPKQVIIYAIEIYRTEPGEGLSRGVAESLAELVSRVRGEMETLRANTGVLADGNRRSV